MAGPSYRRVFKTPLRATEAEAAADGRKLAEVLAVHAPSLLPGYLEPPAAPVAPPPPLPLHPASGTREVPGAAALRKKVTA